MRLPLRNLGVAALVFSLAVPAATAAVAASASPVFDLLTSPATERAAILARIEATWRDTYVPEILSLVSVSREPRLNRDLVLLLERQTGEPHSFDLAAWWRWLWSEDRRYDADFGRFQAALYGRIDERFPAYFSDTSSARIRLDQIAWGGVGQDGIPPLRNPRMVAAGDADYLKAGHVVFGIEIAGQARAYPQRILGWHEMVTDEIAGIPFAGVYCTLCGSMVVYRTQVGDVHHELGTSGFLYRSNKLMYDRATQSLWSTLRGEPVVGPLADSGIRLERIPVVTTSWKAWRRRHPETLVLDLETGFRRDYSEGAAYRDYFASPDPMFPVPSLDDRLANKDFVLAFAPPDPETPALAISVDFLREHEIHHVRHGRLELVILTDRGGASRAYLTQGRSFVDWDGESEAEDAEGKRFRMEEDRLVGPEGLILERIPAHRAFWFGWQAAFPTTRLVS